MTHAGHGPRGAQLVPFACRVVPPWQRRRIQQGASGNARSGQETSKGKEVKDMATGHGGPSYCSSRSIQDLHTGAVHVSHFVRKRKRDLILRSDPFSIWWVL